MLRNRDAVRLAARSEDGPRWSTAELLGVEQAALRVAAGPARDTARTV